MIKNYFKIAWRNLLKHKSFTIINVVGLSIAFGIAVLLSMAAFFDLSFDQFHENKEDIYQLYSTNQESDGPESATSFPIPFTPAIKSELPEVKRATRYNNSGVVAIYQEKELHISMVNVDKDFFSIFSFPILKGDKGSIFKNKSDLVISEDAANRIFGGTDKAIGKTLSLNINNEDKPFIITAVLKDFKSQSSIKFDIAIPFENKPDYTYNLDKWNNRNHDVYVQLNSGVTAQQFEKSTRKFSNLHFKDEIQDAKNSGAKVDENGQYKQIHLVLIEDIHFVKYTNGKAVISRFYPYLILGIALVILFIACVNFINMSIGTSVNRLKEIGMRKTLGAEKKQLFFQFWGESLLVFTVAIVLGLIMSALLLNQFKTLFSTQASFAAVFTPTTIVFFLFGFLFITLIAGGYPSLLLSKLGTLQSLKGKMNVSGKNRLRNVLIVVQFCIAILMISSTLILWSQLQFMRNKNLGFNKTEVFAFPLNGKKDSRQAVQLLRNELRGDPNIESITAADNILGRGKDGSSYFSVLGFEYKGKNLKTNMLIVDYDYVKTLDLQLVKGRTFDRNFGSDSLCVVVNETMAKKLEEKNPLDANFMMDDSVKYSVIGVVKDYNFQGLNKEIEPITFFISKDNWGFYYAYVKAKPNHLADAFDRTQAAWKNIEPNATFEGSFLDENIDRTFKKERVMTTMITSGAVIAILLSCTGLFALSLLVVGHRTKEIGVRKVVGASVSSLTLLLSKDFMKLVLISLFIATPISWFMMSKWLDDYVYRIDLSPLFFIIAGLLAIFIASSPSAFK
ncbi:MAG: ABC transporter permease, partial [Bacteroidetes bacterium]|nr:ABC transporter permease [Bacteroidota bacterium]